ncbi:MAG TPA: hypothetical protein VFU02_21780 [Polyangiaceae bacterium]|nr:hypothetical protein [Polyangiaceae bacterium]
MARTRRPANLQNCGSIALFCVGSVLGFGACGSESSSSDGNLGPATGGNHGPVSSSANSATSSATGEVHGPTSVAAASTGAADTGGVTGSASGGAASTAATGPTTVTTLTTAAVTGDTATSSEGVTTSSSSTAGGSGGVGAVDGGTGGTGEPPDADKPPLEQAGEPVFFGTTLDPVTVMSEARARAEAQANPEAPNWRATGDQDRTYHFDATNRDEPFRLYVPTDWDGESKLPLVMFLHGAGSDQNTYLDQNDQLMLTLAQEHGFLLVSALGAEGAYGNFLRLSAPFGNQAGADELMAQVTPESERANELSEMDVINVLEVVLEEYPIDLTAIFLTGHSMGSGGTWYIGGKYSVYFRAIAPMSGPFVQETGYPWDNLRDTSILVTEGTQTPSLEGSQLLAGWLVDNGFDAEYIEVDADHGGMVPLVLPDVFDFFDEARSN